MTRSTTRGRPARPADLQHRGHPLGRVHRAAPQRVPDRSRRSRSPRWCRTTTSASSTTRRSRQSVAESPMLKDRVDYISETIEASAPDGHRPDDDAGRREPRRLDLDAGRHPVHPDRHRGGPERDEGARPSTCSCRRPAPGATFIGKEKLGGDGSAGDGWWVAEPRRQGHRRTRRSPTIPTSSGCSDAMKAEGHRPRRVASTTAAASTTASRSCRRWPSPASSPAASPARTSCWPSARIDMTSPMLLPGIRLHMDGLKDAYIVEGGMFRSGTRPSRPTRSRATSSTSTARRSSAPGTRRPRACK